MTESQVPTDFFSTAAQVIPVFLVLLAVDARRSWSDPPQGGGGLVLRILTLTFAIIAEMVALFALLLGGYGDSGVSDVAYLALAIALLFFIAGMLVCILVGFIQREWSEAASVVRKSATLISAASLWTAIYVWVYLKGGATVHGLYLIASVLAANALWWWHFAKSEGDAKATNSEPDADQRSGVPEAKADPIGGAHGDPVAGEEHRAVGGDVGVPPDGGDHSLAGSPQIVPTVASGEVSPGTPKIMR